MQVHNLLSAVTCYSDEKRRSHAPYNDGASKTLNFKTKSFLHIVILHDMDLEWNLCLHKRLSQIVCLFVFVSFFVQSLNFSLSLSLSKPEYLFLSLIWSVMVVVGLVTGSVGLVIDRWGGSLVWWLIGGSGGDWWFDLFMWVSDCRVGWLVGLIGDRWLGLLLVWVSDLLKSGLLGSTCLRWFFLGLRFFFFWVGCVVFLDWFGTLGLWDLMILLGFEKMVALRFMSLFFS